MKLTANRINGFLNNPDPTIRVILVYGPDAGLVRERAAQLAKKTVADLNDPFRVATLSAANLTEDTSRLFDEMATVSLGGGRRLVRIQNANDTMAMATLISKLLADLPPSDSLLLIEAGDLDKRSKLRVLCDSDSPHVTAIPCYIEDNTTRQRTITDILAAENIRTTRDVVAVLADLLPPDRMAMRSELEKFSLYVGRGNIATIDDVHASIQDAGDAQLDDLVFAVGAGETKRAAQLMDRLYGEQTPPVAILRAAQRHFIRLHWARGQMDAGLSATDAVKRLQPPVFWKYEGAMASQLRRWKQSRAEQALHRLYEAEAAVKRSGTPDSALCAQVLLGLAA